MWHTSSNGNNNNNKLGELVARIVVAIVVVVVLAVAAVSCCHCCSCYRTNRSLGPLNCNCEFCVCVCVYLLVSFAAADGDVITREGATLMLTQIPNTLESSQQSFPQCKITILIRKFVIMVQKWNVISR